VTSSRSNSISRLAYTLLIMLNRAELGQKLFSQPREVDRNY